MKFVKPERLWLRDHASLNEKWVQDRIAEDPTILGLGELVLKDKERMQPRAGRLDLLLQDSDDRRYEVEIQLGKTDESHIIRTLEYWDIERKRYPQYDHCAVLVAEDITSRFLNVISLFNSSVPIIAVQMTALALGEDQVALVFNKVLDELARGLEEEENAAQEPTDRAYWLSRAAPDTLTVADRLLEILKQLDTALELNYNKFYIGLARDGAADNFVIFKPTRSVLRIEARVGRNDELDTQLHDAGLDLMSYSWNRYRIRLSKGDLSKHEALIADLLRRAYVESKA